MRMPNLKTCLIALPPAMLGLLASYLVVLPVVHYRFGFCPLTISRFEAAAAIPVVYGLPGPDLIEEARQGRVVLGGCVVRWVTAICPHCRVGVEFRSGTADAEGY